MTTSTDTPDGPMTTSTDTPDGFRGWFRGAGEKTWHLLASAESEEACLARLRPLLIGRGEGEFQVWPAHWTPEGADLSQPTHAGWRKTLGEPWRKITEGQSYEQAMSRLLDAGRGMTSGSSVVLPVGQHPNDPPRRRRRCF